MLRRLMMAGAGSGGGGSNILVPPWPNVKSLSHFDNSGFKDAIQGVTWASEIGSPGVSFTEKKFGLGSLSISSRPSAIRCVDPTVGAFGTRDFTVAGWIRPTWRPTVPGTYAMFATKDFAGANYRGWQMNLTGDDGGKLTATVYPGGTTDTWRSLSSSTAPALDTWSHVALCRRGDMLYLFLDGVLQSSTSLPAGTIGNSTGSRLLYGRVDGGATGSYAFAGQMDEFIIVDGVGMFVEDFVPPSAPYSKPAEVVSLLHFDGADGSTTFTDEKGLVWGKHAGASLATGTKKFGTASARINGPLQSNITCLTPAPGFDLIGSDFTIALWVRVDAVTSDGHRLFATGAGDLAWNGTTGIHVLFQISSTGKLEFQIAQAPSGVSAFVTAASVPLGAFAFVTASWKHSEQRVYLGVNGVVQGSSELPSVGRPTSAPLAAIGKSVSLSGSQNDASCLSGWVDDLVLVKHAALYTANFTPPTAPFPDS